MLRCSAEAFARCPARHLCGRREDATYAEGSECDLFNRQVEERPVTNGDRLRAMSDCELAMFINHVNICDKRTNEECRLQFLANCESCVLDWLQSPAEVQG